MTSPILIAAVICLTVLYLVLQLQHPYRSLIMSTISVPGPRISGHIPDYTVTPEWSIAKDRIGWSCKVVIRKHDTASRCTLPSGAHLKQIVEINGTVVGVDARPHKGGRDGVWIVIRPDSPSLFETLYPYHIGAVYALYEDVEFLQPHADAQRADVRDAAPTTP